MYEGVVQDLIDELGRLPGVGPKSAQRIAFHLLAADPVDVTRLQEVLQKVKDGVRFCEVCGNVSERERCRYCADPRRDPSIVCVVASASDVLAIERGSHFRGRYHVLHGTLAPLEGIGPDELRITELIRRLGPAPDGGVAVGEVIIATAPTVEGESTAMYLARLIKPLGVRVSRIATGLPVGGDLEYTDQATIARALAGRSSL